MGKPFYFEEKHFIGYFTWSDELTSKLDLKHFNHACHETEFKQMYKERQLILRSSWTVDHPLKKKLNTPGIWTTLEEYPTENYFGPFIIKIGIDRLTNKRFMVFKNNDNYFFVQHQSPIPVFMPDKELDAEQFFFKISNKKLGKDFNNTYFILLTEPVKFKGNATFTTIDHFHCHSSSKCNGYSRQEAENILYEFSKDIENQVPNNFYHLYDDDTGYKRLKDILFLDMYYTHPDDRD